MEIRDRVKDFRRVRAGDLKTNPQNPVDHNEVQRDALRGILAEVGFAGAVLARELEDGSLELIDGHLRQGEFDDDQEVPTLILDVSQEEAAKLLASINPIAQMVSINTQKMSDLTASLEGQDAEFRRFLTGLRSNLDSEADQEEKPVAGKDAGNLGPPAMELRPHEHYDYFIVLCRTIREWNRLCELLDIETVQKKRSIGIGKGVPAAKLIEKLTADAPKPDEPAAPARKKPGRRPAKKKKGKTSE